MTAYYNEIDPFAAQWLRELIKVGAIAPGVVDTRSITEVRPDELKDFAQCHFFAGIGVWSYALRLAGWPDDRPVWTGSCPCQPFSHAGRRKGFSDDRHLWPVWSNLIGERHPPVVFGEQVAGPAGLAWFDAVSADLERAGYAIGAADLCAAGVGAPHIRQRLYFVADSARERYARERLRPREESGRTQRQVHETSRRGETLRMVNDERARLEGLAGAGEGREGRTFEARPVTATGAASPVADAHALDERGRHDVARAAGGDGGEAGEQRLWVDPWAGCDFIPCSDGKARPAEPGTFPLVDGAPARLVRLRGYGNAIVAPLAKTFIEAYLGV